MYFFKYFLSEIGWIHRCRALGHGEPITLAFSTVCLVIVIFTHKTLCLYFFIVISATRLWDRSPSLTFCSSQISQGNSLHLVNAFYTVMAHESSCQQKYCITVKATASSHERLHLSSQLLLCMWIRNLRELGTAVGLFPTVRLQLEPVPFTTQVGDPYFFLQH